MITFRVIKYTPYVSTKSPAYNNSRHEDYTIEYVVSHIKNHIPPHSVSCMGGYSPW